MHTPHTSVCIVPCCFISTLMSSSSKHIFHSFVHCTAPSTPSLFPLFSNHSLLSSLVFPSNLWFPLPFLWCSSYGCCFLHWGNLFFPYIVCCPPRPIWFACRFHLCPIWCPPFIFGLVIVFPWCFIFPFCMPFILIVWCLVVWWVIFVFMIVYWMFMSHWSYSLIPSSSAHHASPSTCSSPPHTIWLVLSTYPWVVYALVFPFAVRAGWFCVIPLYSCI